MKKIIKIAAILTGVGFGVAGAMSSFADFNQLKDLSFYFDKSGNVIKNVVDYEIDDKFDFNNVDELIISTQFGEIEMVSSSDTDLHVHLKSKIDEKLKPIDASKIVVKKGNQVRIELANIFNDKSSSSNFIQFNKHSLIISDSLKVIVSVPQQYKKISIDTISADYKISQLKLDDFKLNTISGDVQIKDVKISQLKLDSVSGDIKLKDLTFSNAKINTVSGDVKFEFAHPADFSAQMKSVSGDLSGDSFFKKYISGNSLTLGSSDKKIKIDTISGDAHFEQK